MKEKQKKENWYNVKQIQAGVCSMNISMVEIKTTFWLYIFCDNDILNPRWSVVVCQVDDEECTRNIFQRSPVYNIHKSLYSVFKLPFKSNVSVNNVLKLFTFFLFRFYSVVDNS